MLSHLRICESRRHTLNMYPFKNNLFPIDNVKPKREVPKVLKIFYGLAIALFGFNYGFIRMLSKRYRTPAKMYSIFMNLFMFAYILLPVFAIDRYMALWYFILVSEFIAVSLILLTTKYTLYNYLMDIQAVCEPLTKELTRFGIAAVTYIAVVVINKIVVCNLSCLFHLDPCPSIFFLPTCATMVPALSIDILPVGHVLIPFNAYIRVRYIRNGLRDGTISIDNAQDNIVKLTKVKAKITPFYNKLIVLSIAFDTLRLMADIYYLLNMIKKNRPLGILINIVLFAVYEFFRIVLPSCFVEMITARVDEIKMILHDRLITKPGNLDDLKVVRLLRYLDVQYKQYNVCGVIPMDVRLPISVISVCTTYLIIIIQFTHLYD